MKCDYCGEEDHLISACRQKSGDRGVELGGGCFLLALLSPFALVGILIGAISGAFMSGFRYTWDLWDTARMKLRGKRDEPPTV